MHAITGRYVEVFVAAYPRNEEHAPLGSFQSARGRPEIRLVRGRRPSLSRFRSVEPQAVADLDHLDAGILERRGDDDCVPLGELKVDHVAAIAQRALEQLDVRHWRRPEDADRPYHAPL